MKQATTFAVGFLVGMVAIYLWGQAFGGDSGNAGSPIIIQNNAGEEAGTIDIAVDVDVTAAVVSTDSVSVAAQAAGDAVQISSVDLQAGESGGWVVVHETNNGVVANALGAVRKDSGVHSDVAIHLLRATVAGGTYAVVLYDDNGDKQFSMKTDKPLTSASGEPIMSTFIAQ